MRSGIEEEGQVMPDKMDCSEEEEEDVIVSSVPRACRQQGSGGAELRRDMARQVRRWYGE
jgi:hypothetical protein